VSDAASYLNPLFRATGRTAEHRGNGLGKAKHIWTRTTSLRVKISLDTVW